MIVAIFLTGDSRHGINRTITTMEKTMSYITFMVVSNILMGGVVFLLGFLYRNYYDTKKHIDKRLQQSRDELNQYAKNNPNPNGETK